MQLNKNILKNKGVIELFIIVRQASTFYGMINLTNEYLNSITLNEGDKLIFTVKKDYHTNTKENILISKTLHDYDEIHGGYPFVLTPDETDISSGTYYYDIGLQCSNGEFYHITMTDEFIVKESVSRKEK